MQNKITLSECLFHIFYRITLCKQEDKIRRLMADKPIRKWRFTVVVFVVI